MLRILTSCTCVNHSSPATPCWSVDCRLKWWHCNSYQLHTVAQQDRHKGEHLAWSWKHQSANSHRDQDCRPSRTLRDHHLATPKCRHQISDVQKSRWIVLLSGRWIMHNKINIGHHVQQPRGSVLLCFSVIQIVFIDICNLLSHVARLTLEIHRTRKVKLKNMSNIDQYQNKTIECNRCAQIFFTMLRIAVLWPWRTLKSFDSTMWMNKNHLRKMLVWTCYFVIINDGDNRHPPQSDKNKSQPPMRYMKTVQLKIVNNTHLSYTMQ